jgi:beta-fructofuranosidase
MLAKKLVCTNLFEGVEGGFPLWRQMGLSKMNHTFEETHNKAIPADPSDPLPRKWVKVHENPIARHPSEIVSNITFRDPTVAWQEDDGS